MLSGAYSSIFVAAPIAVALKEREPRNRALRQRLDLGRLTPPTTSEIEASELIGDDDEDDTPAGDTRRHALEAEDTDDDGVAGSSTPGPNGSAPKPDPKPKPGAAPTSGLPPGAIPPRPRKKGKRR
jgi:hypothetical protein